MVSATDIFIANILIVDDKEANVLLLTRMLGNAGYSSVTSTTDSSSVCELHRENHYDLILLDLQMPGKDGFQVMGELKEIEKDGYLPVLVITAQPDQKLRALREGAKDFISKPFEMGEVLARVYNMIEVRLLNLESKNLYLQVINEKKRSEKLLFNVLPRTIAERLIRHHEEIGGNTAEVIADSFAEATVLFADIVGFTKFSASEKPEQIIQLLNEIFTDFDTIADQHGLEKIKSIGDAYMAATGLPIPVEDHAVRAAHMALDMLDALVLFNERSGQNIQIRIGISSGPVVAGVIGRRKFIYDLWGATVNTASRMESHGIAGRVHISDFTHSLLDGIFQFEERTGMDIKDLGEIRTWFLSRK